MARRDSDRSERPRSNPRPKSHTPRDRSGSRQKSNPTASVPRQRAGTRPEQSVHAGQVPSTELRMRSPNGYRKYWLAPVSARADTVRI